MFTRILIPDVLLSLLIAASLYFFLTALEDRGRAWHWYAGYACMALGVLTKGLIALAFPGGAAFFYLADHRGMAALARVPAGFRARFIFADRRAWHILAGLRNTGGQGGHGFFWFYFVNEHFLRFLGKRYPRDYNKLPWALVLVAASGVAVSVELLSAGGDPDALWTNERARPRVDFGARTRLLCWILAGLILIFFADLDQSGVLHVSRILSVADVAGRRNRAL